MGNPMERRCAECVYYDPPNGRCRHSPPTVFLGFDNESRTFHPYMMENNFCGEWRGVDGATFLEDAK